MRHAHKPFMMKTYGEQVSKLNEAIIGIKLHYTIDESKEDAEKLKKARSHRPAPTWKEVEQLLSETMSILNEYEYNPVKY